MIYMPGPMLGFLSGTAGNTTASRNASGGIIDVRRMPMYVSSPSSSQSRVATGLIAKLWNELTDDEVNAWQLYGATIVTTNALGVSSHLNAYQAFQKVQKVLFSVDLPNTTLPPASVSDPMPVGITVTANSPLSPPEQVLVGFQASPIPADRYLILASQPAASAQRSSLSGPTYKQLAVLIPGDTSPFDLSSLWLAAFGDPPQGQRVFIQATIVTGDGLASTPAIASGVVS